MSVLKGSATTHTFSKEGLEKYDTIQWNSSTQKKCNYLRYFGKKGSRCLINNGDCTTSSPNNCPVLKDRFNIN